MATPKRKRKKRAILTKEERELTKALRDLSSIIPVTELAKKFKLKPSQIYRLKKYRKRVPLPKEKRKEIIDYWEYLKKAPKREDLLYQYRVVAGRIIPSPSISFRVTRKVIEELGVEEVARQLKVSPQTVKRWYEESTLGVSLKTKRKLFRKYRKISRHLVGLCFVSVRYPVKRRRLSKSYNLIIYSRHFNGTEEEFKEYITTKELYGEVTIEDCLINEPKKFKEREVAEFFEKYLPRVDKNKLTISLNACYEFLNENFKDKALERLTKILEEYERTSS